MEAQGKRIKKQGADKFGEVAVVALRPLRPRRAGGGNWPEASLAPR